MPLSLKIFSVSTGRKRLVDERVLDDQRISVGRGPTCTIVLEDPSRHLSRLHAEFEQTPRGYLLRVMSAAQQVLVNGVAYSQGSEVTVHAGDIYAMAGYDLEVVSVSVGKLPPAALKAQQSSVTAPRVPAKAAGGTGPASAPGTGPRGGRAKWLAAAGVAAVAVAILLAFSWQSIKALLPEAAAQKRAEQQIARLEGEARSLLKLVDGDRREIKEATAASSREIERVEGLVRSTRTSQDRLAFDAALGEARRMAKASVVLEDKVRERVESPSGLPKAEGRLNAATAAARSGDRAEALRLLEETVASLAQMRASIAADRKATQAELEKRREALLAAETRVIAEAEARARAEAEARAKAKAKADAEAAQAVETDQAVQSAQIPALPCLGRLSGVWSHPAGGTWTFTGNQGSRVVESKDYGSKAQQITVMNVYSCEKDTLTYKYVRFALTGTDDPSLAYDRTEANTPSLTIWAKVHTLRYSISKAGLRLGNYTYAKR